MADTANRVALYASVGPELTHYEVDVEGATLTRRATLSLPANVHYVWPHASRRFLYVASSDSASGVGGFVGRNHHVTALGIDRASGALSPHGMPITLPTRPIHMTTDIPSEHILVAFSNPSGLCVYRVNRDGTPGDEVGKPEEPGGLQVFDFRDGELTAQVSIAPNGGFGFGPRHLDFHPTEPWVYVSLERQNRLDVFAFHNETLLAVPVFQKGTLAEPDNIRGRQAAGTVHVHPNGRFVYVANRASSTIEIAGARVFAGGENTLAVYAIDPATGEPNPIQHVDTHGIHCRTFHIDPSGQIFVAAHIMGLPVKDGAAIREVPACLSVFRIGPDGKLDFVRK